MSFVIQNFPLVAAGGVPPYAFSVVNDAQNTFNAAGGANSIVAGPNLHLDATSVYPGVYAVHVRVTDSATPAANTADSVISVIVDDPTVLSILNDDQDFLPASFPLVEAITLNANGGTPPYTWSLVPAATTVPSPTITGGNTLNFTLSDYGSYAVGLNVVDSVGNSAAAVVLYTVVNPTLFAFVDGQLEVEITVPPTKVGTHHFSATVQDSSVPPGTAVGTFYYAALEAYSETEVPEAFFDHVWDSLTDTTAVVYPIMGLASLQGYTLGSPTVTQPQNGLTVAVDNVNDVVRVSGPPALFQNSQVRVPLQVLHGPTQVALISREYTLLARSSPPGAAAQNFPRPYIVGDLVGLNPQKPWFNSPSLQKNASYTARVQAGSSLPPGLSLDANTSLIYGNVVGTTPLQSVIELVDPNGIVQRTITVNWTIYQSQFTLTSNLGPAQIQQAYSGTLTSNSASALKTVTLVTGVLPTGLTASIGSGGTTVVVSGTPLEAGYFDMWFAVTNASNQTAYLYVRFTSDFILPLTILTTSLPTFSDQPYSFVLQGFGGVPPYTWSLDATSPALPAGITLSSAGVLAGTYTNEPTAYSANLVIDLADSETPPLKTSAVFNLTYNNTLSILTPAIPIAVPGQPYSFSMTATGGVPPYSWAISPLVNGLTFPTGIVFSPTGVFSGATDETSGSESVTITVTDSSANTAMRTYTLQVASPSGLVIDTADVGPVPRGTSYQGHVSVSGYGTAPYAWQIPPSSPNPLPSGLVVTPDAVTSGVTATISGIYSGPIFTNLPVEIEVIDANGQTAVAYMFMSTASFVEITNTSLPVGEISGAYSAQLFATGGVPPYVFSLDALSPALPGGFSLTSGGLLSGTTALAYNQVVTFDVADSLSPPNTNSKSFQLLIQSTNLTITNTSPLPTVTSGVPYSVTLTATESPLETPFSWSISPSSTAHLPPGITLNSATGVVSGTTQNTGSYAITFRVTDSLGAFDEKTLVLPVVSGLALLSGIDYSDGITFWAASTHYALGVLVIDSNNNMQQVTAAGTSGGSTPSWATSGHTSDGGVTWNFVGPSYIGYIDNGNVSAMAERPNDSFFVVATGVVSTSPGQLTVTVGSTAISGIAAHVQSITAGVAQIQLTGPFSQAPLGDSSLSITVTDSGVQASAPFSWKVFNSGALRLAPGSGGFPALNIVTAPVPSILGMTENSYDLTGATQYGQNVLPVPGYGFDYVDYTYPIFIVAAYFVGVTSSSFKGVGIFATRKSDGKVATLLSETGNGWWAPTQYAVTCNNGVVAPVGAGRTGIQFVPTEAGSQYDVYGIFECGGQYQFSTTITLQDGSSITYTDPNWYAWHAATGLGGPGNQTC